ncbi:hypothetical protein ACSAZK_08855 [Methanosarcina sp. Mfa9]|uniref:hypothetical protein n=1 Tax=Methanosarcina sp. Mfa9 TaxID=3439063 RepID=UPI003F82D44D
MRTGPVFIMRFVSILCLISALLLLSPQAAALSLELEATEYVNDLVFYPDGTYGSGSVTGSLSVTNPSPDHTVSDINISFGNGITPSGVHINELPPKSTTTVSYEAPEPFTVPLPSVRETVEPLTLYRDMEQEVVFRVEISNPGSENIYVLSFDREFPEELEFASLTFSAGSPNRTGNNFHWENFSVSPGSAESLLVVFNTTPVSDIVLQPSSFSFTTPSLTVSKDLSLSAVTSTRFAVEKQKIGKDQWNVGVVVEDASDFDCLLSGVEVYVSDLMLTEPKLIREYAPDLWLRPGESWRESFTYEYEGTPVFFAKVFYTIPCTISGSSMPLTASESGGFVISSIVCGTSDAPGGSLGPEGSGDVVVDPDVPGEEDSSEEDSSEKDSNEEDSIPLVVPDEEGSRHHSGDGERLWIIRPIYPVSENEPEAESVPRTNEENTPGVERVETEKSRFNLLPFLLPLLLLLLGAAGRKFLLFSPPMPGKQLVTGSSQLKEIYGINGFELLFSGGRSVFISKNEFNKLWDENLVKGSTPVEGKSPVERSKLGEAVHELVENGRIMVVDTEIDYVHEIMARYGISTEDADILAAAEFLGVKEVLLTTPKSENTARKIGPRPVKLTEILSPAKPESS